jgi:hypothetical protein
MSLAGKCAWSCVIGFSITALLAFLASIPALGAAGILLVPGMFVAAIVPGFREGVHSNFALGWILTAGLFDVLMFSWIVMLVWTRLERPRSSRLKSF